MLIGLLALLLAGLLVGAALVSLQAMARRRLVLQRLYGMQEAQTYRLSFRDEALARMARAVSMDALRKLLISMLALLTVWLPTPSGHLARKRRQIARAIPEFAARLYCLMELGFCLESAVGIITLEHPARDRALKSEWFRYLQDIRMGVSRKEGLIGLRSRAQVQELADLVGALLLAGEDPGELRQRCRESVGRLSRMAAPRPPLVLFLLIGLELLGIWALWKMS